MSIRKFAAGCAFAASACLCLGEDDVVDNFPVPGHVYRNTDSFDGAVTCFMYPDYGLPEGEFPPEFRSQVGIHDGAEGFNRNMFAFNHFLMRWVVRPVGTAYSCVFPRYAIDGIARMAKNIEWPDRFFSCLLEGRPGAAGEDTACFLINVTMGGVGFYDVADSWFGLKWHDEDFGQAFASWGMGPGTYLCLPIAGPSSARDTSGLVFDMALDPKTYIPYGGSWFFRVNAGAQQYSAYESLTTSSNDPYVLLRDLWYVSRQLKEKE